MNDKNKTNQLAVRKQMVHYCRTTIKTTSMRYEPVMRHLDISKGRREMFQFVNQEDDIADEGVR